MKNRKKNCNASIRLLVRQGMTEVHLYFAMIFNIFKLKNYKLDENVYFQRWQSYRKLFWIHDFSLRKDWNWKWNFDWPNGKFDVWLISDTISTVRYTVTLNVQVANNDAVCAHTMQTVLSTQLMDRKGNKGKYHNVIVVYRNVSPTLESKMRCCGQRGLCMFVFLLLYPVWYHKYRISSHSPLLDCICEAEHNRPGNMFQHFDCIGDVCANSK